MGKDSYSSSSHKKCRKL